MEKGREEIGEEGGRESKYFWIKCCTILMTPAHCAEKYIITHTRSLAARYLRYAEPGVERLPGGLSGGNLRTNVHR